MAPTVPLDLTGAGGAGGPRGASTVATSTPRARYWPQHGIGRAATPAPTGEESEDTVAKPLPEDHRDPGWPQLPNDEHPVTELMSDVQGNLSPFGDMEFPLADVPYVHPSTEVNR